MTMIDSIDARTGAPSGRRFTTATNDDVDKAVLDAHQAADALARAGRGGRAAFLRAAATELETDREKIIQLADQETALGIPRLTGELVRTCTQLRLFADALDEGSYLEATIDRAHTHGPLPQPDLRRMLIPLGPVAVFGASNFPLAFSVAGGDTASALAAGCPVVVKAHQAHPATSYAVSESLQRALSAVGLPAGVLSLVFGREAGTTLVAHPAIKAVGFTGSVAGGRALFDIAQQRPDPIPFYGELGALNTFIVSPAAADARGTELGTELAESATLGVGQFCTKPGLAFIPAGAAGDRVIDALRREFASHTGGVMLTGTIRETYDAGVVARREQNGVTNLIAGDMTPPENGVLPALLETTAQALTDVVLEECFGPVLVVHRYPDLDALLPLLDTLPAALTGSVHALESETDFAASVEAVLRPRIGRLVWNGFPTGVAVSWAQHHGGPWPATTNALHTSVGTTAIRRFLRPFAWQNAPSAILPEELRDDYFAIPRRVDGNLSTATTTTTADGAR